MRTPSFQVIAAVGLGVALGAASWFADQLAWPLSLLLPANAIGAWLGVAFVAGATGRNVPLGALRGLLALATAVAAYYLLIRFQAEGIRSVGAAHAATIWGLAAAVAGPVMGAAGAIWRGGRGWPRAISIALLAAVLVAEGVAFGGPSLLAWDRLARDPGVLLLAVEASIGLMLPALCLARRERPKGYVSLAAIATAGVIAIGPVVGLVRGLADRF